MNDLRIDLDVLSELKEMLEDEFVDLINTYIRDTTSKLEILESSIQQEDFDSIRKCAHSMKGASVNLGVQKFGQMCHLIEEAALVNDLAECETIQVDLKAEGNWVLAHIRDSLD